MKIAMIASYAPSVLSFRGQLIQDFLAKGAVVYVILPQGSAESDIQGIERFGAQCMLVPMASTGMNPVTDLKTLLAIRSCLKQIKPTHVLAYTIKPVIYGMLAARSLRIQQRFALITGLGSIFIASSKKAKLLSHIVKRLYCFALGGAKAVIFQNPDDQECFVRAKMIKRQQAHVVNGSGVDMNHYAATDLSEPEPMTFLLISRLLKDKGIREYVSAAKQVRKVFPKARFQIGGYLDQNPSAIKQDELDRWVQGGIIEFLGKLSDVRKYIATCHVYVLPSYQEGTPRSVLEAMSMGRAIITTDAPGCRETVIDGENGYLVSVRSADALADAMIQCIQNPKQVALMGRVSRKIVESRYDVHKVNLQMLTIMGLCQ